MVFFFRKYISPFSRGIIALSNRFLQAGSIWYNWLETPMGRLFFAKNQSVAPVNCGLCKKKTVEIAIFT
jgi:hypothetical protein